MALPFWFSKFLTQCVRNLRDAKKWTQWYDDCTHHHFRSLLVTFPDALSNIMHLSLCPRKVTHMNNIDGFTRLLASGWVWPLRSISKQWNGKRWDKCLFPEGCLCTAQLLSCGPLHIALSASGLWWPLSSLTIWDLEERMLFLTLRIPHHSFLLSSHSCKSSFVKFF